MVVFRSCVHRSANMHEHSGACGIGSTRIHSPSTEVSVKPKSDFQYSESDLRHTYRITCRPSSMMFSYFCCINRNNNKSAESVESGVPEILFLMPPVVAGADD